MNYIRLFPRFSLSSPSSPPSSSTFRQKRKKRVHDGIAPCGKLLRNPRGFIPRSRYERKNFIQIQLRGNFGQDVVSSSARTFRSPRFEKFDRKSLNAFFFFFCTRLTKYRTDNLISSERIEFVATLATRC